MKTKLIYAVLTLCLGCFLWSCEKTKTTPETTLGDNLIKSAGEYADLMGMRPEGTGSFSIEDIKREDDVLSIRVRGGCREDDFTVVWDGSIAFSDPGQVNLVLKITAEDDCGLEKGFDIRVDLRKILGKHDPKNFIFNVANGSVKQDKSLNPNGSVTSK